MIELTNIKTLDEIGILTGTDKSSSHHNYLKFYDSFFSPFRYDDFTLVEVGIYNGDSLRMWEEYFPYAHIIAYDINPKENTYKRTTLQICDASDPFNISAPLFEDRPFIFIDDGSHFYSHQINTFEEAFILLKSGGFYIIEDIQTSFGSFRNEAYNDQELDTMTYLNYLTSLTVNDGKPDNFHGLENVSKRQIAISKRIDFIAFRRHCALIKKA